MSKKNDWIGKEKDDLCILVVEDSSFLKDIFRKSLRTNHKVYVASGVKEGWRLYVDKNPDIVFIDIGLPDGNGHDLTRMIKKDDPSTYVIVATASDNTEQKEISAHNHADGFIGKPFTMKEIEDCIQHCLDLREREKA